MARTTRQQRRQRRAQTAGTPPLRPAPRQRPAEEQPADAAVEAPSVERQAEGRRGFPGLRFLQEAIAELKKVEWPTQQQVVSGTAVVLVACLIFGVYLYANDRVWSYVVEHVLLR
ncbi:MAG TPA: preprotein translocase subunit SecE [Gaiellaceae bacterium]|nr:preprotein translocase subunit SecE [Gaiellaceae bacterium]